MKKVIASAGLLAIGTVGIQNIHADTDMAAGPAKPWSISGSLRAFYDDNYNTQPSGPARNGSFGFEVRPSGMYTYSDGPTMLKASYLYALYYYGARPGVKYDQTHDFELSADHNFNERYGIGFVESFVDAQDPQILAGPSALSSPLRANGDNFHNDAAITFTGQVTPLFGFVLGYDNNFYDYTGNIPLALSGVADYGTLLNRFENTVTLNSRWVYDPETTFILGYTFEAVNFTSTLNLNGNSPFYQPPNSRNQYSHFVYTGLDHTFTPELTTTVRIGFQASDYYNLGPYEASGQAPSSFSPYAQLVVNYNYMDGGTLSLGFNHSKNITDVDVADEESSSLSASVTQVLKPISPDLTATGTFSFQDSSFNGGSFSSQTEDFYSVGLNLSYQFTQYLSSEIGYNFTDLNSGIAGRGYNRNVVYIGVTATY